MKIAVGGAAGDEDSGDDSTSTAQGKYGLAPWVDDDDDDDKRNRDGYGFIPG